MTKQEFEARLGRTVSEEDYKKIEFVYEFHPSINEYNGKDQIVALYDIGGMLLILDMTATAEKAEKLEKSIAAARIQLDILQNEYTKLKRGEL